MDFKSQQKKFDDVKWFDSILAGEDRCGTYEFCDECDKQEVYPCARAIDRFEGNGFTRIATIYLTIGEKRDS